MQVALATIVASPAYGAMSYFVRTLADDTIEDGLCTLREAMWAANSAPANADCGAGSADRDFIWLIVPGTIVLGAPLPTITQSVLIGGVDEGNTLDGNGRVRAFVINPSVEVTLERLTITDAKAPKGQDTYNTEPTRGEDGGAIHNRGQLRMTDVRITHSVAGRGGSSFYGGARGGHGGAIYNAGTITGYRVTFDENSAGDGGESPHGDYAQGGSGGAIYNEAGATLILYAATLAGNKHGVRVGLGNAVYTLGDAMFRSSTFLFNGGPSAAIAANGAGAVYLSTTIMADAPGCDNFGVANLWDLGFNLATRGGECGLSTAWGSILNSAVGLDTSAHPSQTAPNLRSVGGSVPTIALLTSSPGYDRVPPSFDDCEGKLEPFGFPRVLTDARREERPQNTNCDIGAYEIGPSFRAAVRTLAITGAGSGHGTVTGAGLDCAIAAGAASGQCASDYARGTVVTPTATAAAGSIFVGWDGDPACDDGSVVLDDDKSCTAVFDLHGFSASGSASRVGQDKSPKAHGSAHVKFGAKFAFAGAIDLSAAKLTIDALLAEEGVDGAGELVSGVPIVLEARRDRRDDAAIFETPRGATPRFRAQVQIRHPSRSTVLVHVDRATIPGFPKLCSVDARPTTELTTAFTIDDGVNPPVTVTTRAPWRCLDPTGGDPLRPRSLRTP